MIGESTVIITQPEDKWEIFVAVCDVLRWFNIVIKCAVFWLQNNRGKRHCGSDATQSGDELQLSSETESIILRIFSIDAYFWPELFTAETAVLRHAVV